jgi:C1A family cysteine protease
MNRTSDGHGLGWLPDHPDFRDHTPQKGRPPDAEEGRDQRDLPTLLNQLNVQEPAAEQEIASSVDLSDRFPPVEDQGDLGSCTANAGVGLLEYFELQASGRHLDASRLFLYKATRNLMGVTGDTGAYLRTTMQAMVLFGIPPEEYMPYEIDTFDEEPAAFYYSFARNYRSIEYYRLDPPGTGHDELLSRIRTNLAASLPSMFGFTLFSSYTQGNKTGEIPYPVRNDRRVGGHAVIACGYDDDRKIRNAGSGAEETVGALMIRNSWGAGWGADGYGWLPYEYVRQGLAIDWWSLMKAEWVDASVFGLDEH